MPIDEVIFKALNDLRQELEQGHDSFRHEYLSSHAALGDGVTQLSVGQAGISSTLKSVLERVNKTNGFVGEHEGRLRLQEGMIAGIAEDLKRLNESFEEQIEVCKNTRGTALPRLEKIEIRNVQRDAIEQSKKEGVARKIKYEVINKLADKAVEAGLLLAGYVMLKLWIFKG